MQWLDCSRLSIYSSCTSVLRANVQLLSLASPCSIDYVHASCGGTYAGGNVSDNHTTCYLLNAWGKQ